MPRDVTRLGPGTYRVRVGDRYETVYVAGSPADRWAFWNGHVYRTTGGGAASEGRPSIGRPPVRRLLSAPMPATVVKVLARPGAPVAEGDVLVVLEAMKMELAIRAPAEAIVKAVHCREGDLVRADQPLVEMGD